MPIRYTDKQPTRHKGTTYPAVSALLLSHTNCFRHDDSFIARYCLTAYSYWLLNGDKRLRLPGQRRSASSASLASPPSVLLMLRSKATLS